MSLPGVFSDWIMPEKIHQLNVSFTVKTLRREFGGTGGNCAYTLGLLGQKPVLVSILGRDAVAYQKHLLKAGVNLSGLRMDRGLSASGQVMTDKQDNQLWSYYPGPLRKLSAYSLEPIVKPHDLVALLPSEPKAFAKHLREVVKRKARFMFDPAFFIPNLTQAELRLGLTYAEMIIGNDYEIALMENKVKRIIRHQLTKKQVLIRTLGERGSEVYTGGMVHQIPAAKVKRVVDPTGAGDGYRSGFLTGYIEGKSMLDCGRMGAVAAAYTVEKYGTQTHHFTLQQFQERLRQAYG
ncbi:hypothetical protein A2W24_06985 [Microgenomates group bacterium RBG_16_45_19]|nr:MAG: hypothetical protein A2W24_06985 [Microgenomates group bacterium RBG_16_45_19]